MWNQPASTTIDLSQFINPDTIPGNLKMLTRNLQNVTLFVKLATGNLQPPICHMTHN